MSSKDSYTLLHMKDMGLPYATGRVMVKDENGEYQTTDEKVMIRIDSILDKEKVERPVGIRLVVSPDTDNGTCRVIATSITGYAYRPFECEISTTVRVPLLLSPGAHGVRTYLIKKYGMVDPLTRGSRKHRQRILSPIYQDKEPMPERVAKKMVKKDGTREIPWDSKIAAPAYEWIERELDRPFYRELISGIPTPEEEEEIAMPSAAAINLSGKEEAD